MIGKSKRPTDLCCRDKPANGSLEKKKFSSSTSFQLVLRRIISEWTLSNQIVTRYLVAAPIHPVNHYIHIKWQQQVSRSTRRTRKRANKASFMHGVPPLLCICLRIPFSNPAAAHCRPSARNHSWKINNKNAAIQVQQKVA